MSTFIHQSLGRVRIRLPELKNAPRRGQLLSQSLRHLQGVRKISLSPLTGSIIIYYDPTRQQLGAIFKIFHRHNLLCNIHGFTGNRVAAPSPAPLANSEVWMNVALQQAGRVILFNILESTLQKTGRLLLRRMFT